MIIAYYAAYNLRSGEAIRQGSLFHFCADLRPTTKANIGVNDSVRSVDVRPVFNNIRAVGKRPTALKVLKLFN